MDSTEAPSPTFSFKIDEIAGKCDASQNNSYSADLITDRRVESDDPKSATFSSAKDVKEATWSAVVIREPTLETYEAKEE